MTYGLTSAGRFKVSTRLYFGFGLLVIISVGMAGFGITQFAGIGHQVATMSEVSVRVARAARLNVVLETIRRTELRVCVDDDPEALTSQSSAVAEAAQIAADGLAVARTDLGRKMYGGVLNGVNENATLFADFRALRDKAAGAQAKLFTGGNAVTAGKGFAVVASEVKSLATQTAKATEDIASQITQIQSTTKEAVTAIQGIALTIGEVSTIATAVAAAVEEQGAATAEIARNVQQTAGSAQAVTSNISGVSSAANSTGAAAGEVLNAAGDVSRQAATLSRAVDHFISGVKAA